MSKNLSLISKDWVKPGNITQVALGLRYQSHHRVSDLSGTVIDRVLKTKGTPFGSQLFPVAQKQIYEHYLGNPDTEALLRLAPQDTLLRLPMDTQDIGIVQKAAEDFQLFVLNPLVEITELENILRFGFLLQLDCKSDDLVNPPIKSYVPKEFPDANSLSMRFTKRLKTEDGLFKKRISDYRYVIYTIEESEQGLVRLSLDYQHYFIPALDSQDWKSKPFTDFVNQGLLHFQKEFTPWLRKYGRLKEAA
jgi:hypothetical protein